MLKQQVAFIEEMEKLKTITRFNRTLDGRFENSAEHSWHVALASMIFRGYFPGQLNMEKVLMMLLLHDVGEINAGDTWVFDDTKKSSAFDKELQSINKSIGLLPEGQADFLKDLWLEFETGDSDEARYARMIDALVPLINHLIVSEEGFNPDCISSEQVLTKKAFIEQDSPVLWQLVQELVALSVEKGLYHKD